MPYCDIDLDQHWLRLIARCLVAPHHYLNQCWLIVSKVLWYSSEGDFTRVSLKITYLKLHLNPPGAGELKIRHEDDSLNNSWQDNMPCSNQACIGLIHWGRVRFIWHYLIRQGLLLNTLRPRQNGRHFAAAIFKCIFVSETYKFRLGFQWSLFLWVHLTIGDKPLSEPMMV